MLKSVRSDGYLGPIVVVTGQGNEYVAASLTRAGADDYVAKNDLRPDILQRAINNALAQQSRRSVEAQNQHLLAELQMAKKALEGKNTRLSELYETAHQFVDNVANGIDNEDGDRLTAAGSDIQVIRGYITDLNQQVDTFCN